MQGSYGGVQFKAPVAKKLANSYYLVENSYDGTALYL